MQYECSRCKEEKLSTASAYYLYTKPDGKREYVCAECHRNITTAIKKKARKIVNKDFEFGI